MKKELNLGVSFPRQVSSDLHSVRKNKLQLLNEHVLKLSLLLWSWAANLSSEVLWLVLRQASCKKHTDGAGINHERTEISKTLGQHPYLWVLENGWRHLTAAWSKAPGEVGFKVQPLSQGLFSALGLPCWLLLRSPKSPRIPTVKGAEASKRDFCRPRARRPGT